MYLTHYKNMLHSKFPLLFTVIQLIIIGRGLGQSQAEPSRSQQLWPGSGFCQAKAPKSQAKALKARPSRAVHNPSISLYIGMEISIDVLCRRTEVASSP